MSRSAPSPGGEAPTFRKVRDADAVIALRILLAAAHDDRKRIREELDRYMSLAEHNNAVITTYQHRLQHLGAEVESEAQAS